MSSDPSHPILWSFRRCPYAMRARLAIAASGVQVELREIALRSKPDAFLETSPSGTVPCLNLPDQVIDESFDIMRWALAQNDPEQWLAMKDQGFDLIATCDGMFKAALDRYKYSVRYDNVDATTERGKAAQFIQTLNSRLATSEYLMGPQPTLADMAILPFVRQYAHVDLDWFVAQDWAYAKAWLEAFKTSSRFAGIMTKYTPWEPGQLPIYFPDAI